MGVVDDLLKPHGLKYEQLTAEEQITLTQMIDQAQDKKLTPEKTKNFLRSLIGSVEKDLVSTDEFVYVFGGLIKLRNWKQVMLKARLQNYLMLETIFTSPDQAKREIAEALTRLSAQLKK